MIQLFTIGFTNKSAQRFFDLLQQNGVNHLVDTRINHTSQLSGFAKGSDLAFFAKRVADIPYTHQLDYAPTKELLTLYRSKEISWEDYATAYLNLLDMRQVGRGISPEELHGKCLMCSEHTPEKCHRRLLAEYLSARLTGISIHHLI